MVVVDSADGSVVVGAVVDVVVGVVVVVVVGTVVVVVEVEVTEVVGGAVVVVGSSEAKVGSTEHEAVTIQIPISEIWSAPACALFRGIPMLKYRRRGQYVDRGR